MIKNLNFRPLWMGLFFLVCLFDSTRGVCSRANEHYREADYSPHGGDRKHYTASLLSDGRVLLVGGYERREISKRGTITTDLIPLNWSEIFDPATGQFSLTGNTNFTHAGHTAIALSDGRVIIAGGYTTAADDVTKSVKSTPEIWDSHTGKWRQIFDISFDADERVEMSRLNNGSILFFAARDDSPESAIRFRAWRWNPETDVIVEKRVPINPRAQASLAILPDGRVTIIGGNIPVYEAADCQRLDNRCAVQGQWRLQPIHTMEIWNSDTNAVTSLPLQFSSHLVNTDRAAFTQVLKNGDVLLINKLSSDIELFSDPVFSVIWSATTGQWSRPNAVPPSVRLFPHIYFEEDADGMVLSNADRLNSKNNEWLPSPPAPQFRSAIVRLSSGKLISLSTSRPSLAVFDEDKKCWSLQTSTYLPTSETALLPLNDGRLLVSGRLNNVIEAYSIAEIKPSANEPKQTEEFVVNNDALQIFDPIKNKWSIGPALPGKSLHDVQLIQLKSGDVLRIGFESHQFAKIGETVQRNDNVVCQRWRVNGNVIEPCGHFDILTRAGKDYERGLRQTTDAFSLAPSNSSQPILVLGLEGAMLFDEEANRWISIKLKRVNPIYDPKTSTIIGDPPEFRFSIDNFLSDEEASPAVIHYLLAADSISFNKNWLWNPWQARWQKINVIDRQNTNVAFLPDGCIVSLMEKTLGDGSKEGLIPSYYFSIYDPRSDKAIKLSEPIDIFDGHLAVLRDGTVTVVGTTRNAGDSSEVFFNKKASCSGFAEKDSAKILQKSTASPARPSTEAESRKPLSPLSFINFGAVNDFLDNYKWGFRAALVALLMFVIINPQKRKKLAKNTFALFVLRLLVYSAIGYVLGRWLWSIAMLQEINV